jgi:hypothetical protein
MVTLTDRGNTKSVGKVMAQMKIIGKKLKTYGMKSERITRNQSKQEKLSVLAHVDVKTARILQTKLTRS